MRRDLGYLQCLAIFCVSAAFVTDRMRTTCFRMAYKRSSLTHVRAGLIKPIITPVTVPWIPDAATVTIRRMAPAAASTARNLQRL